MSVLDSPNRRAGRRLDVGTAIGGAILLIMVLTLALGAFRVRLWWRDFTNTEVATWPQAKAFSRVFHRPVPPGVNEIRAAGLAAFSGGTIWLRFSATEEATKSLVAGHKRVPTAQEIEECLGETWRHFEGGKPSADGTNWEDHVRWREVDRIKKPECYRSWTGSADTILLIDRRHGIVYVFQFYI